MSAHRCGRRSCPAAAAAAGEPNVIQLPGTNRRISFYGSDFSIAPEPIDQSPMNKYWQLLTKFTNIGYEFWKKVYDDPYRWQLFKSIMLFIMGIKFSGAIVGFKKTSEYLSRYHYQYLSIIYFTIYLLIIAFCLCSPLPLAPHNSTYFHIMIQLTKMSLKEPSEESVLQPHLKDSLENVVLSRSKDGLVVHSNTRIQLPNLPSVDINPKKHGGTRPIPSAEHLPQVPLERIQSNISAEEYSSPPSSQPPFIETLLSLVQHGFVFWRRVFSDSFRWQIFKSLLFFAAGLKLTREYYKHVHSTETPPANVNDREAWLERCKKHKERKAVIGNSTEK